MPLAWAIKTTSHLVCLLNKPQAQNAVLPYPAFHSQAALDELEAALRMTG